MKRSLAAVAAIAIVVAAVSASARLSAAPASSPTVAKVRSPAAPPREIVLYGHVKSLARKGRRFEMRFDPALWLGGVTANRAAAEDGRIRPGESVPNDYYIREEGHRLLTYLVPTGAAATVLTLTSGRTTATKVPVAELAQIIKGRNPKRRRLYAPRLGFWIRVTTDTVRSLQQQYQP